MTDTVYVVTCGAYSDYGISGVFSSEKAALDYCAAVNTTPKDSFDACRVEEYPLDEVVSAAQGKVYEFAATVWDRRDVADEHGPIQVVEDEPTAYIGSPTRPCETSLTDGLNHYGNTVYDLKVVGTDYKRVRKVYGEKLAELKARIEGIAS